MDRDGNQDADRGRFDALVRQLSPDLFRYGVWLCRDRRLAEDLVQETLLRAWRSYGSLRDQGSAKQWMLKILRREHARACARARPETVDIATMEGLDAALYCDAPSTDVLDIRRALARLEAEYREPLVLQVLLGLKAEEIADMLGIKTGAVLTRLCRGRKKLREKFDKPAVRGELVKKRI